MVLNPGTSAILADLEADEARTRTYVRNLTDMVKAKVDLPRVDTILIQGTYFVVLADGIYAFRFGVPPDERMWVAECRNEIADPPGQWDHWADGPLTDASQAAVAEWIVVTTFGEPDAQD